MPWKSVSAVRCERCAVFTPTDDVRYTTTGEAYCTTCGAPPVSIPVPRPMALKRNPVFVAAAAVAAIVASFFVAACASQL